MKPIIITPGEILLEDYLKQMNISPATLAHEIGVSVHAINEIIAGRQKISPEISLRLGVFFKQDARFWYNIQATCDFQKIKAEQKKITVKRNYEELLSSLLPASV